MKVIEAKNKIIKEYNSAQSLTDIICKLAGNELFNRLNARYPNKDANGYVKVSLNAVDAVIREVSEWTNKLGQSLGLQPDRAKDLQLMFEKVSKQTLYPKFGRQSPKIRL